MAGAERPKRVVVVDADNPLVEINGEFFWREDHEEILARERDSAYRRGGRWRPRCRGSSARCREDG